MDSATKFATRQRLPADLLEPPPPPRDRDYQRALGCIAIVAIVLMLILGIVLLAAFGPRRAKAEPPPPSREIRLLGIVPLGIGADSTIKQLVERCQAFGDDAVPMLHAQEGWYQGAAYAFEIVACRMPAESPKPGSAPDKPGA